MVFVWFLSFVCFEYPKPTHFTPSPGSEGEGVHDFTLTPGAPRPLFESKTTTVDDGGVLEGESRPLDPSNCTPVRSCPKVLM